MDTNVVFLIILLLSSISRLASSSKPFDTLTQGSSLSVEKPLDVLTSRDGVFSAGFFPVGVNAYCFAVWFNEPVNLSNRTVVWMANRDRPVNGKGSKLSLLGDGSIVLKDAGLIAVWDTATASKLTTQLHLYDSGNLVLLTSDGVVLWQSFDSPTDTLLPEQPLTRYGKLISSRSQTNVSSGFYKLFFDNDNVLRLIYDSIALTSVYWPSPWLVSWDAGRSTYNNTKTAVLDSLGNFSSSDDFTFMSADYGPRNQRMLRLDYDGNVRLYSRKNVGDKWAVTWQAFTDPCKIHGVCGDHSLCSYSPKFGRKCSCLPGHKMRNRTDWFYGCEPEFTLSCRKDESRFVLISHTEFYGYDYGFFPNYTFKACQDLCLRLCNCVGFQYSFFVKKDLLSFSCYPKTLLVNGAQKSSFPGDTYLRVPKNFQINPSLEQLSRTAQQSIQDCPNKATIQIARTYKKNKSNSLVKFMLWFSCGVGVIEAICILLVWCLLFMARQNSVVDVPSHVLAAAGFRRFSFSELKKATKGFSQEIGRGGGGVVYRAILSDSRVAAIKRLSDARQGEAEFLAEVSTIGRLNHMNLIEMWGYCMEGKHRLLVYEYLELGSLKDNLTSHKALDWEKRFEIALGTAKGLAYLHDECLEWVLHCDVKPQNILLDSDYQPKVADFGLSKLLERGEKRNLSFSRIRGTRGYMAPEWVTNQTITSKVDVYSYGVVLLEMLTGRTPISHESSKGEEAITQSRGIVRWVKESLDPEGTGIETMDVDKIIDSSLEGEYDKERVGVVLRVALNCVEDEKEARPTMKQVVQMLQHHVQNNEL